MGATRPKPSGVTEIFSEYVRQRQQGNSQQDVVNFLRPLLNRVRDDARQQLAALIRSWEAREGVKYQAKEKKTAFVNVTDWVAPPAPDEDLSWLPESASSGEKPRAGLLDTPVHPSMQDRPVPLAPGETFYCPACGTTNRLGDAYCYACGALLNVQGLETRDLKPATAELEQVGQSYFGRSSTLLLTVLGSDRPFTVPIHEKNELTLGRASVTSSTRPDVDLSPYHAGDFGVSRIHARLRCQDDTITITDLESVNHTYINGQLLHPQEVRVLRDGDEIRLGRLEMKVSFQHRVRKLQ
jgi:hypothetical protein